MKAKPAATRGTVHAETGKPPVKASKPTAPATKAETVEKVIKARAAAIGIDPKKVIVGMVGAKSDAKSDGKPADKPKPAAPVPSFSPPVSKLTPPKVTPPAKPADKPKPVQAAKPADKPATPTAEETARAWCDMANRHAREMVAFGISATPPKGAPCVRFISGVYVPAARAAEYRAIIDRHRDERAKMRDNTATARGVYLAELRTFKGDEIAALYALGLPHIADKGGVAVPVIRGNRALALAWRDALAEVSPGKVSQIVTVRTLGKAADKPADKPKPADEKPKGLGMVAKIEAKADTKPAKAKPKK